MSARLPVGCERIKFEKMTRGESFHLNFKVFISPFRLSSSYLKTICILCDLIVSSSSFLVKMTQNQRRDEG